VARLILLNKPYRVLSQFTDSRGRRTLADYIDATGVYPAGRLDYDSEGLLLLTDDGALQARIADPRHKMRKTYWLQVLGAPGAATLSTLTTGVSLRDGVSRAAHARLLEEAPELPPREPPVVTRHAADSCWLEIVLTRGRNREARRLLAAVGHPVLRLVRVAIGPWRIEGLAPGAWRETRAHVAKQRRHQPQGHGSHASRSRQPRTRA
jgi:23S rRNA pseudouridine2457 synthase